jgi:hypothetical protein
MSFFDGTSGATAIVAGVVALIQSAARIKGTIIAASDLRTFLRNYGSEVWKDGYKQEGRVPDLRQILDRV